MEFTIPFTNSVRAFPFDIFSNPKISTNIFFQEGALIPPDKPTNKDIKPIDHNGDILEFINIANKRKDVASIILVMNKTCFLEYWSANLPPNGDAKGWIKIGIEPNIPTKKDELVFSNTNQLTKINLKKNVEKANAPENKWIEKKIFLPFTIMSYLFIVK